MIKFKISFFLWMKTYLVIPVRFQWFLKHYMKTPKLTQMQQRKLFCKIYKKINERLTYIWWRSEIQYIFIIFILYWRNISKWNLAFARCQFYVVKHSWKITSKYLRNWTGSLWGESQGGWTENTRNDGLLKAIPGDILVVIQVRNSCRNLSTSVSMLHDNFSMSTTPSATSLSNDTCEIFFRFKPEKWQLITWCASQGFKSYSHTHNMDMRMSDNVIVWLYGARLALTSVIIWVEVEKLLNTLYIPLYSIVPDWKVCMHI